MDREDLHDLLFPGSGSMPQSNPKPTTHHPNIFTSPLNTLHPNQLQNKSNNKTREDLEALIEGIPFPNDDISFTSFNSGHSQNATPQKFNQHYQNQYSNHHQQESSDDRSNQGLKANKGFSNENRQSQSHFPPSNRQKPVYLDFNKNENYEDNLKVESLSDWNKQHVTQGNSNMLFPQVTAPTMEITGDGSFTMSRGEKKKPFDFGKGALEQQDISNDDIGDDKDEVDEPKSGLDPRIMGSVGDSLLRIEVKRYQDQLATVESELGFQKKKYSKLEQENNYLTQRMNDLEDQLQFVQEKYSDHSSLDTLRGRNLANAKTQLKQVKGLLEKKEEKVEELILQVQQLKKNEQIYREAVEKEITNLRLEIDKGRILTKAHQDRANELEAKYKENTELNAAADHKKDHLIENLKAQVKDLNERVEEMRSQLQKNKGTIEKLAMHVHEREELLTKATEELEQKEREVEALKKHSEGFLMEQHRLTNLESDKVWEQKYAALNEELMRVKGEKDREVMRLKEIVKGQKEQLRIAEDTIIRKDEEISMSMGHGKPTHRSSNSVNVLDSLLQEDSAKLREEEWRNQKVHYEKQISMYRGQIEELSQRINAMENENVLGGFGSSRNAHFGREEKMTVSQSTSCTLYLEPIHHLMSAMEMFSSGSDDVDYEEELGRILDHFNQVKHKADTLERNLVEFKKRQIASNSELDCTKMENEQMREMMGDLQQKDAENAEKIISLHSEIADLKKTVVSLEAQTRMGSAFGGSPRSTRSRRDTGLFGEQDDEAGQELLQLREDYKSLENEYSAGKEMVKKLQMKCKELELEVKRLTSQHERGQNELELLKIELETKSANEKSHWEQVKKGLNERIKGLESKSENLVEEVRRKDLTIAELEGRLDVAEVSRRDMSYASEGGVKESSRVSQLEKRNRELVGELEQKEEEITNFRLRMKEVDYELEQERVNNGEEMKRRQAKIKSLEEELERYRDGSETLSEQVSRLNEILEKRDMELNKLLNEKQTVQMENERLSMGLDKEKSREEVLNKMNETLNAKEKQVIEMRGRIEELMFDLKKEKERNQKLKDGENDKERKLEDVTNKLREKENEVKHVVESAKKKESHDTKTTSELNVKKQEIEKLQGMQSQMEKEVETLKKERNELKKTLETTQKSLDKAEFELKKKEEAIKQSDEKNKRDAQYLKDKDKANLELFKVNKNLTENIKTLEETHNNLKAEFEKKSKMLAQKMSEIKGLTQSNKKLEESNQELGNEVMELKVALQQMETELANMKVQALKTENLNESDDEKEYTKESTNRTRRESEHGGKTSRQDIERLLQSFSEREAEFENIKNSFVEKMTALSEQCGSLVEENNILSQKVELYQQSNDTLKEKVSKMEANFKQGNPWTPFNDSGIDFNKMDTKNDPLASLRKTQGGLEEYDDDGYDIDELKPPRGYETNPMKYASYSKNTGEHDMKSTVGRYDEKATSNVFQNNIMDMISPEMLSTEETVSLVLEVLRRASQSHKLAVTIGSNREFKELTNTIRKQCVLEEQSENVYPYGENVSFTGRIRRQNRQSESFYSKYG